MIEAEIKGPAHLYRILAPHSRAISDCWVTEEIFNQLKAQKDPRAAWRKHLAVWPDWNGNGQFFVYDVKPRESLKVWRAKASTQFKDNLPDRHLEGGWVQIVFNVQRADRRNDTMRYYTRNGGNKNRLQNATARRCHLFIALVFQTIPASWAEFSVAFQGYDDLGNSAGLVGVPTLLNKQQRHMKFQLNPQEIYLLERYTSVEYFGTLRDVWGKMIGHLENCLDDFMKNLPADYRNRRLREQPDVVWGNRVLPNFRITFEKLCSAYIRLSHGEPRALAVSNLPLNDAKGQTEFWSGWMSEPDRQIYANFLNLAVTMAGNIQATEAAFWPPLSLSKLYSEAVRGPLVPPLVWPKYRIVKDISLNTGQKIKTSGIYAPDIENACPQFLNNCYPKAPSARVFLGVNDLIDAAGEKYSDDPVYGRADCVWMLIERESDSENIAAPPSLLSPKNVRVLGGEKCQESGYYSHRQKLAPASILRLEL